MIAISIVSHNHVNDIIRLLNSLEQNDGVIIVVRDNFGSADIERILDIKGHSRVELIKSDGIHRGYGENHNLNFLYVLNVFSHATHFAVINPDVIARKLDFRQFSNIKREIVAPLTVNREGELTDFCRTNKGLLHTLTSYFDRRLRRASNLEGYLSGNQWLSGAFLCTDINTYKILEGFDTSYFMYYEDADFCRRAHKNGFKLRVLKDMVIEHEGKRNSKRNWRHLSWHVKSLLRYHLNG